MDKELLESKKIEKFVWNCLIEAQRMFRYYCYLYRKLPKETENEVTIDSDSSEQETKNKDIDVVGDEFRIFKSKELRLEEIGREA